MKTLKQFIEYKSKIINTVQTASEYLFEDYCKDNDIIYPKLEDWDKYNDLLWVPEEYKYLNQNYQEFLLETEMYVFTYNEVIDQLNKYFSKYIHKIQTEDYSSSKNYRPIKLYCDKNIINDKFISTLNFCNWSGYDYNDYIYLKPNKTEDITLKVYNYPFIYHYCPKFIYETKIKKYGLNPKHKFGSKYEKIYCFYNKDPEKTMRSWARLKLRLIDNIYKKNKAKEGFVLLTIDLTKDKRKIHFWKDEESNSDNTFYTFEPISPFCIINVEDIKIDKP